MRHVLTTLLLGATLTFAGSAALASENTPDHPRPGIPVLSTTVSLQPRPTITSRQAAPSSSYRERQIWHMQFRIDNQEGKR